MTTDRPCYIDTIADLRFRMFLNAPEKYAWGAIDMDGNGYVYEYLPDVDGSGWASEDYLPVGRFPQYADEWNIILVERDDAK